MLKRVLITGALGQLGNAVTIELQPHFKVCATGRFLPENKFSLCEYRELDITKKKNVNDCIQSFSPDVVVHLACITDVDGCEINREQAWITNVIGTENILNALRGSGAKIVFISSDYVFDGTEGPYSEEDIPSPINYYGKTKLAAENLIRGSLQPWVIIRTNVLFGNSLGKYSNFMNWIIDSLSNGKQINVVDDQINNPSWTVGLAEAIKFSIIIDIQQILNYGGAEFMSRSEFAYTIARFFDLERNLIVPVKTHDLRQVAPRPLNSGLSTVKIQELLGIRTYGLDYCLRKIRKGIVV